MEGPDGSTSDVKNFGTSSSNAENRTAALNKLKLAIKEIITLSPAALLETATQNVLKRSLGIINNLRSDQGDEIAALLKVLVDSFDELLNALAEIKPMSNKEILDHFYGDKINSLRESLNETQATTSEDLETAKTNAEES